MRYKIAYSLSCSGWVEVDATETGIDIVDGYCSPMAAHGVATEQHPAMGEALIASIVQVLKESTRNYEQKLAETTIKVIDINQSGGDA